MPVGIGKEGEYQGLTGTFKVKPSHVAEKMVKGKDGRADAWRVVFDIVGQQDKTVSLFVPISPEAPERLYPFMPDAQFDNMPTSPEGIQSFISQNMPTDPLLVYVYNNGVRSVTAEPGTHRAQLDRMVLYTNQKGETRARLVLKTKEHKEITWTCPWPHIVCKTGGEPDEDDIGPAKELSPNKSVFQYLIALGLDWERFGVEMVSAYQDGKLFSRLGLDGEEEGFFDDPSDITPALVEAVERHGKQWVEVEVIDDKKWGPGPKRGKFSMVELKPVIVDESSAEFEREKGVFLELWDNLTCVILQKDDARFLVGTKLTEDGHSVAVNVLKPLVCAYPDAAKQTKEDGGPVVFVPPNPETWTLNGLVCANLTAERLMKAEAENPGFMFETVSLSDPKGLLAWVVENVPEWQNAGDNEGGEEL